MKEVTHHELMNPANTVTVTAVDEIEFNCRHVYDLEWPVVLDENGKELSGHVWIYFQKGHASRGCNGVTNESLIAVVLDRLYTLQESATSCRENACAITKLEEALHWLIHRTARRTIEKLEGTMEEK